MGPSHVRPFVQTWSQGDTERPSGSHTAPHAQGAQTALQPVLCRRLADGSFQRGSRVTACVPSRPYSFHVCEHLRGTSWVPWMMAPNEHGRPLPSKSSHDPGGRQVAVCSGTGAPALAKREK